MLHEVLSKRGYYAFSERPPPGPTALHALLCNCHGENHQATEMRLAERLVAVRRRGIFAESHGPSLIPHFAITHIDLPGPGIGQQFCIMFTG